MRRPVPARPAPARCSLEPVAERIYFAGEALAGPLMQTCGGARLSGESVARGDRRAPHEVGPRRLAGALRASPALVAAATLPINGDDARRLSILGFGIHAVLLLLMLFLTAVAASAPAAPDVADACCLFFVAISAAGTR